jgi:hypothetical protein
MFGINGDDTLHDAEVQYGSFGSPLFTASFIVIDVHKVCREDKKYKITTNIFDANCVIETMDHAKTQHPDYSISLSRQLASTEIARTSRFEIQ